jgi:hypothetical protein
MASAAVLRTLVVFGLLFLQTSKLFEKREIDKTFDDARWVLTITRVVHECRDTSWPTGLYHDTWSMSILTDVTKGHMKETDTIGVYSLAELHPTRPVTPC